MHLRALCFCPFLSPPPPLPHHFFPGCVGHASDWLTDPQVLWQLHGSSSSVDLLICLPRVPTILAVFIVYAGRLTREGHSMSSEGGRCSRTWVFISLMTLTFCPMEPRIRLSDFLWLVVGYCSLTGSHRHRVNAGGRQCPGDHLGRCALISMHGRFSSLL